MKKVICLILFYSLAVTAFSQNEASNEFVRDTVLARQSGSVLDKFPKMEIGFVGRQTNTEPLAFLFFRLQSTLETGGGTFLSFYMLNRSTNQLDSTEGDSFRQFMSLLYQATIVMKIAKNRDSSSIDWELGEIELTDFQWYMTQNQWRYSRDKTCRIKVKVQSVGNENRVYFYRTADLRDSRNEFDTFTMPNDVYLTERQCQQIIDGYEKDDSFVWKAIDTAIDSANRAMR